MQQEKNCNFQVRGLTHVKKVFAGGSNKCKVCESERGSKDNLKKHISKAYDDIANCRLEEAERRAADDQLSFGGYSLSLHQPSKGPTSL